MHRLSLIAFIGVFLMTGCASKTTKSYVITTPQYPSNPAKVSYSTAHTPKVSPTSTNKTFDTNWVRHLLNDEVTVYYDSLSIEYAGYPNKIKVWQKMVFHTPQSHNNGDKYDTGLGVAYYDCYHRKYAYKPQAVYYLGKSIWSDTRSITDNHPIEWNYVLPDTIGMDMLAHICSHSGLRP